MASYSASIATQTATDGTKSRSARSSDVATPSTLDATKPVEARAGDAAPAPSTLNGTKPVEARAGDAAPAPSTLDAGKPVLDRSGNVHPGGNLRNAVLVPGDFRGVEVLVVDPRGEPLPEVEQLLVLSPFPSSTKIGDDATGSLPMLSASYTDFRGLAPRSEKVGYVWYEGVDNVVGPQDDEAVIVLDPRELKGLYAGRGAEIGGMFG
jgi:hypothetical protein